MPKILLYITAKITLTFLFLPFDFHENRAHVHVSKKTKEQQKKQKKEEEVCKIWLEPKISIAKEGTFSRRELHYIMDITQQYHSELLLQWAKFKKGETVKIITIKV
jgi:hypothetical protein